MSLMMVGKRPISRVSGGFVPHCSIISPPSHSFFLPALLAANTEIRPVSASSNARHYSRQCFPAAKRVLFLSLAREFFLRVPFVDRSEVRRSQHAPPRFPVTPNQRPVSAIVSRSFDGGEGNHPSFPSSAWERTAPEAPASRACPPESSRSSSDCDWQSGNGFSGSSPNQSSPNRSSPNRSPSESPTQPADTPVR